MTKRPLLLVLIAFVLGEVFEQRYSNMALVGGVFSFLLLCVITKWRKEKLPSRWLFLLPFFIVLGGICFGETNIHDPIWETLTNRRSIPLIGTIYDRQPGKLYLKKVRILDNDQSINLKGNVIIYTKEETAKIGETIEATGKLGRIEGPTNPGQFDGRLYYGARGTLYSYTANSILVRQNARYPLKEQLYQLRTYFSSIYLKLLDEQSAGVIAAMVLGEKELLEPETKDQYARNGIAHILSISGLHVSFLGHKLFRFLKKRGVSYLTSGITAGIVLVLYCILTGMGDASIRAMIMLLLRMFGDVIGRTYDGLSAMSFAGLFMLIEHPLRLFDAGFLLSYSAIAAIGVVIPLLEEHIPKPLASSIGIAVSTLPIVSWFYFELSTYSVFVNLIVIPLTSVLLPFGILGLFIGCGSLMLGRLCMLPVVVTVKLVEITCRFFETLPFHTSTIGRMSLLWCFIYYVVLCLCLYCLHKKRWNHFVVILMTCIGFFFFSSHNQLKIVCLDVGQGDGIFIKTPSGTSYLFDGGSTSVSNVGKYTLMPAIKYYGIGEIDYVILSHMDKDHISGAIELMDLMPINYLVLPDLVKKDAVYLELVEKAKLKGIHVLYMGAGDQIKDQQVTFTCYHPSRNYAAADANDASLVLGVEYKEFSGLFTGDLEMAGENAIISNLSDYDFLKVGHHGSNSSSGNTFLETIKPEIAVISCGKNNTYGHPHKEVLDGLVKIDCITYITMDQGAILIDTDGETISVDSILK